MKHPIVTLVALLLAATLSACGRPPSALTVEGLEGLLTPAERASLDGDLDGDTLDLSGARFALALDEDACAWTYERGSVRVHVAVEGGLLVDVRSERESCAGRMTEDGYDLVSALTRPAGPDLGALEVLVPKQRAYVAGDGFVVGGGLLACERGPRVFVLDLHGTPVSGGAF